VWRTPAPPLHRTTRTIGSHLRTIGQRRHMSNFVSTVEAANILGCSETLVRKRVTSGVLPAEKVQGKWRISREDLDSQPRPHENSPHPRTTDPHPVTNYPHSRTTSPHPDTAPPHHSEWRDDLVAQVARIEADKVAAEGRESQLRDAASRRDEDMRAEMVRLQSSAAQREELSKARIIDLERELTARDSRIVDLTEQVAILEAKVREVLEAGKDEALQLAKGNADLANRIADLVAAHEDMHARVVELQPVAEQVPMLQAAVEEKDASLSEREIELGNMRQDIDAIASRPVTGPVFRLLTKGKLRR
jgi:excisionase family DNA binding protein